MNKFKKKESSENAFTTEEINLFLDKFLKREETVIGIEK